MVSAPRVDSIQPTGALALGGEAFQGMVSRSRAGGEASITVQLAAAFRHQQQQQQQQQQNGGDPQVPRPAWLLQDGSINRTAVLLTESSAVVSEAFMRAGGSLTSLDDWASVGLARVRGAELGRESEGVVGVTVGSRACPLVVWRAVGSAAEVVVSTSGRARRCGIGSRSGGFNGGRID